MFAIFDKAKPHTENIRGLNLVVVIVYNRWSVYTAMAAWTTVSWA
jgi:hypothetical protein